MDQHFAMKLAASVIGERYVEPKIFEIPAEAFAQYEGLYTDTSGNQRRIENRDGKLHSQRGGGPGIWIVPISTDRFDMEDLLTEMNCKSVRRTLQSRLCEY